MTVLVLTLRQKSRLGLFTLKTILSPLNMMKSETRISWLLKLLFGKTILKILLILFIVPTTERKYLLKWPLLIIKIMAHLISQMFIVGNIKLLLFCQTKLQRLVKEAMFSLWNSLRIKKIILKKILLTKFLLIILRKPPQVASGLIPGRSYLNQLQKRLMQSLC